MSNIKDTADAVKGIVEAVPIYEDMLQPATKELGKGLETITKVVNIALSPLTGFVWGYEKIAKYLEIRLAEKLKNVSEENIVTPDPSIAVPAIEALRYTANKEELREMFSNLIATAMNKCSILHAHPSFVEVIKQLTPDEAKILCAITNNNLNPIITVRANHVDKSKGFVDLKKNFTDLPYIIGCSNPENGSSYIENINRLGLIAIDSVVQLIDGSVYERIISHPEIKNLIPIIEQNNGTVEYRKFSFSRTYFGEKFFIACIN